MKIFIGSSSEAVELGFVDDLALWIEELEHQPVRWNAPGTFSQGLGILEGLIRVAAQVDAALLVFTGDDHVEYRNVRSTQPRDNVLLEYGLFCASLGAGADLHRPVRRPEDARGSRRNRLLGAHPTKPERARREIRLWVQGLADAPTRVAKGVRETTDAELTQDEQRAFGLLVSDPQASTRGTWLYPIHQQLTTRGFSDAGATAVLDSLLRKGAIEYVEVDTTDTLTGSPTKAPAYRTTPHGMELVDRYESVREFRER